MPLPLAAAAAAPAVSGVATAGLKSGADLLSGLFSAAAQKKREEAQQALAIAQKEAEDKRKAEEAMGAGQMSSMDRLMGAYNSILTR